MISPAVQAPSWDDATALAGRIRAGEISARAATAAAIGRIRALNPHVNAVVVERFEVGLERAECLDATPADAPFHGVPFLRKDLGLAVKGEPLYLGNRALREADFRPDWTSELARRFDALGLVSLGLTNTAEMGAQTTTQPLTYGPTRNPWDFERSASGSSGGAAAAVACGMVPVAHGNDYLGSIRLPAAWNGVLGMIGSRGRVPLGPAATSPLSREFVLARSVRDLAAVLDGVHGYAPGELWVQAPPRTSYIRAIGRPPARRRVGVLVTAPGDVAVHPEIAAAVEAAGRMLESLGHEVQEAHPASLFEDRSSGLRHDRGSDYRRRIRVIARLLGREVTRDDVEPFLWEMARRDGESVDAHLAAEAWQREWSARVTDWWERDGYDLLVTPTIATPAQPLRELAAADGDPTRLFEQIARHVTFTEPFNVTGQPALALPWGSPLGPTTAPASVQLVGAPGRDDLVLAVAAQLEAASPALPPPPVSCDGVLCPAVR